MKWPSLIEKNVNIMRYQKKYLMSLAPVVDFINILQTDFLSTKQQHKDMEELHKNCS